jgi:signal transduction histidine kinase
VSPHNVLIVSDDTEFARAVMAGWQAERHVPAITVVSSEVWHRATPHGYELVIVGPMRERKADAILSVRDLSTQTIWVAEDQHSAHSLRNRFPQLLVIPQADGWTNTLILIAGEALRRAETLARAQHAERVATESESHATLGRYMLEMRPSVNNALTSVLGNAELLLLEPGQLSAESREQIKTIHTMALRLIEIMQRFSSLASEIRAGEKDSHAETMESSHSLMERT